MKKILRHKNKEWIYYDERYNLVCKTVGSSNVKKQLWNRSHIISYSLIWSQAARQREGIICSTLTMTPSVSGILPYLSAANQGCCGIQTRS
jgi:hypothetical protein